MNLQSFWTSHRTQIKSLIIVSAVVLAMTAVVGYSSNTPFQRFIGNVDPIGCMTGAIVLGGLLFAWLLERKWAVVFQPKKDKTLWGITGLTIFLAFNSIWLDRILVFPENMNIGWPSSILFYPAIGFFVEILFHLLPFTILLWLSSLFFKEDCIYKSFWPITVMVALLEPAFQVFFMEEMPIWATAAVSINLFLFNVLQLYTFKKYSFLHMYALRLVFYFIWHILWGMVRLQVLF